MNAKRWALVLAVILAAALALACFVSPVGAQCNDPICAAEIIARATAQAQATRAAQSATAQAVSVELTRQAGHAVATRQANDALATRQVIDALATRQAIEARQQAQDAQARATSAAIDAEVTRAAIAQAEIEQERQERTAQATEVFLYLAFALGLAGLAFILWRVYLTLRAIEHKANEAATGPADLPPAQSSDDGQAIDGEFTERNTRGL